MQNSIRKLLLLTLITLCLMFTAFAIATFSGVQKVGAQDTITSAKAALATEHGNHDGWTKLSSGGAITVSGNYYLTNDISAINMPIGNSNSQRNITICLNGHKITGSGGSAVDISLYNNVTICDCNGSHTTHYYTVGSDGKYNFNATKDTAGAKSIEGGLITGGSEENGGGVNIGVLDDIITLEAVTIAGNSANYGGGVYADYLDHVNIKNCVIEGNVASIAGGGIYADGSNLTVDSSSIINNVSSGNGGGIGVYVKLSQFSISNSTISGNKAKNGGGFYYTYEQSQYIDKAQTIENCTVSGNTATVNGGGIDMASPSVLNISNTPITSNTASGSGGGMSITQGNVNISGTTTISSNKSSAKVEKGDYDALQGGGGVYISNGSFNMSSGEIKNNTATSARGGGILAIGTANVNLSGGTVSSNSAATGGGAYVRFATTGTSGAFNVKGSIKITDNTDSNVYLYSGTNNIININGAFTKEAEIGVTITTSDGKGQFAKGFDEKVQEGISPSDIFIDDSGRWTPYLDGTVLQFMQHYIDGHDYTPVSQLSQIVQGSSSSDMKYYYLTKDITGTLTVTGYVTIDLSGNMLKGSSTSSAVITIQSGELTIIDSEESATQYYTVNENGSYNFNASSSTPDAKTLNGGVITGGSVGVSVTGGVLNLKGGTVAGNSGAGISAAKGTVNISDGGVYGNLSTEKAIKAEAAAALTISGGYIGGGISATNITIKGGYFTEGNADEGTIYGYNVASGYVVIRISSTNDDPNYIAGYEYGVYNSDNLHENSGTVLTDCGELEDGYYYLDSDLELTQNLVVKGTVTICLHGHTLSRKSDGSYFPDPSSPDRYAITLEQGASLTICSCKEGGYLEDGIYYNVVDTSFHAQDSYLTITGGHIDSLPYGRTLKKSIQGGYFNSSSIDSYLAEGYIAVSVYTDDSITSDTDYDSSYSTAVYKKAESSVVLTPHDRDYNGIHIRYALDVEAEINSYASPPVYISYYTDSECTNEIDVRNTVNAGTYWVKVSIKGKFQQYVNEKVYYPAATGIAAITIRKITPTVSVEVEETDTLYEFSDFPAVTVSESSVEGSVSWAEGETLVAGSKFYTWVFTPTDTVNYNVVTGQERIIVTDVDDISDVNFDVQYGDVTITYSGGSEGLVEYKLDGGEWVAMPENGKITLKLAASWEIALRYTVEGHEISNNTHTVYTTAANVLQYINENENAEPLDNGELINTATAWLENASGDKEAAEEKLNAIKTAYDEARANLTESIEDALEATAKVTGMQYAFALASVALSTTGCAVGAISLARKGGKKDEDK